MSWAGTISIWIFVFGLGWLTGWVMKGDEDYERANREHAEAQEKSPGKWVKPGED